jgi:surface protein
MSDNSNNNHDDHSDSYQNTAINERDAVNDRMTHVITNDEYIHSRLDEVDYTGGTNMALHSCDTAATAPVVASAATVLSLSDSKSAIANTGDAKKEDQSSRGDSNNIYNCDDTEVAEDTHFNDESRLSECNSIISTEIVDSVYGAAPCEHTRLSNSPKHGENCRRASNTKATFRSVRSFTPGAVLASSPSVAYSNGSSEIETNSNAEISSYFGRMSSNEFSTSNCIEQRPGAIAMHGMNVEYSSTVQNVIVAEVVEPGLDMSERRRIVEETLQRVSSQTVTAQVVVRDDNKSVRKHRAIVITLIGVMAATLAAVTVLILRTRSSSPDIGVSDINPSLSPTQNDPRDNIFRTTVELYDAVDAYLIALNGTDSAVSSEVALKYGHPMNTWNVYLLRNFTGVFAPTLRSMDLLYGFNENLSEWDVSNAETMAGMFENSIAFQGIGLENWNVSQVVDFSYMFFNSNSFNGTVSKWDTSSATTMDGMFLLAEAFNDDLSLWDVSNVQSMNSMFGQASVFEGTGLGNWNVGKSEDFLYMFWLATAFNEDLSLWDVSNAQSMNSMFAQASLFEGTGLEYWNVGKVKDFSYMFYSASVFQGTISTWDTSSAETMESMLSEASSFWDNVSMWDVSNVINMNFLFNNAVSFSGDGIARWNVSKVTSMQGMFSGVFLFDEDLSSWDTSSVTDFTSMVSAVTTMCVQVATNDVISLAHVLLHLCFTV